MPSPTSPTSPSSRGRRWGFILAAALLSLAAALLCGEAILRLTGFHVPEAPVFAQETDNHPLSQRKDWIQADPVLLWRLRGAHPEELVLRREGLPGATEAPPAAEGKITRLVAQVESLDFAPPPREKPEGLSRVLCLGDSCTFFGKPSYPRRLETRLAVAGAGSWQVLNAGVPGYSSHQGLELYRRHLASCEPDLVTILFGWNDHWAPLGLPDHLGAWGPGGSSSPLAGLRILALVRAGRRSLQGWSRRARPEDARQRVPVERYGENLRELVRLARLGPARVILMTAPHGLDPEELPEYLLHRGYLRDLADLLPTHEAYNQVVRQAARETGAELLDLERLFQERPDRRKLFLRDGIHYKAAALDLVAQELGRLIPGTGSEIPGIGETEG